jgi:hypothetical protein
MVVASFGSGGNIFADAGPSLNTAGGDVNIRAGHASVSTGDHVSVSLGAGTQN